MKLFKHKELKSMQLLGTLKKTTTLGLLHLDCLASYEVKEQDRNI